MCIDFSIFKKEIKFLRYWNSFLKLEFFLKSTQVNVRLLFCYDMKVYLIIFYMQLKVSKLDFLK